MKKLTVAIYRFVLIVMLLSISSCMSVGKAAYNPSDYEELKSENDELRRIINEYRLTELTELTETVQITTELQKIELTTELMTTALPKTETITEIICVDVSEVIIDKTELTLKINDNYTFEVKVKPSSAVDKSVSVTSDNSSVAEVKGFTVTAKSAGTASITFSASSGTSVSCQLTVKTVPVVTEQHPEQTTESTEVLIESCPSSINRGDKGTVKIKGLQNSPYYLSVTYKSGDSKADGLGKVVSDNDGYASWTWKVGARTALDFDPVLTIRDSAGNIIHQSKFKVK